MPYFVYILRSSTNQLYIGQTNNFQNREKQHFSKSSKAAKFICEGEDWKIVYTEEYTTRIEAMGREKQLKGWTRAKKEALVSGKIDLLKNFKSSSSLQSHLRIRSYGRKEKTERLNLSLRITRSQLLFPEHLDKKGEQNKI